MNAPQPASMPLVHRSEPADGPLAERPVVKGLLRALNVVGGLVASLIALVVVGLYAALQNCEGGETAGLCVHHAGLVNPLELAILVISVAAPTIGGIAAFMTKRPRWLAAGAAIAVVMFAAMSIVSTGQTPFDFG